MQIFGKLAGLTIRKADRIISVSEFLRSEMKQQLDLDSEVQYNKIDILRLAYPGSIDNILLQNIAQDGGIFSIGRVAPYKGLHLLLDAFRFAHQRRPEIKLLIAGDLSRFAGYSNELTEDLNSAIKFLGYISDEELAFCYMHCDVYATASLWEGFDLPAVEAQVLGKPVVAFDIGSHREVIKDGETGILVPPGDVEGFANALIRALECKEQMGQNAQKWAQNFI